jgi:branched chain amino acid efflux pump
MRLQILWLVLGMAAVTLLPRFIPLAFFNKRPMPARLERFLHYMPTAIMAAIVFPALFSSISGGLVFEPRLLLAALPVFLFSIKTKNLWGAVILGMASYWALGLVFTG